MQNEIQQPDYDHILQRQDFFPKIFLTPSQIKLDNQKGLRIIKRYESHQDKFEEQEILPITIDQKVIQAFSDNPQNQKFIHPAGHGLLSLFKRTPQRRIKLAICICVYSQPKHMLKSTIKGIQQSYKYFMQEAGIMPHEIIMMIIFDGIEKVNDSKDQTQNMISFFTEIDIKNGFRYKPYGKSLESFLRQVEQKKGNLSVLRQQRMEEINLFTEEQLVSLQHKLFENQYYEYKRIQDLLKQVKELKSMKNLRLQSLPVDVNKRYQQLSLNYCIQNNMWYQTQQEIQQYLSTKKNQKNRLIYQALNDTERLCRKYLDSRQHTAILYPVRMETDQLRGPVKDAQWDIGEKPHHKKEFNYMFFCVKHKNQGKLSSHMMFFEGFCKLFDPEYCILADVGVKPQKDAIFKMFKHMELNPKCGGVCGYMGLRMQNQFDDLGYRNDGFDQNQIGSCTKLWNCFLSIQRAQQFEYHYAHMIDKPFESFFNFIHVLPGAFSGYRWKALKSVAYKSHQMHSDSLQESERQSTFSESEEDSQYQSLMKRYLKTAMSQQDVLELSLQDSNMYLAEDRIMCLCIHALGYDIHYLPDAESYVDPVTSLTRLLGQRRRWINGSWFAFNYVRNHSNEVSSWIFFIQLLYYSFVQKLSWISISIFYVSMNLTLTTAVREYVSPMLEKFFLTQQEYQLSKYKVWIFNVKNISDSLPDIVNFVYIIYVFSLVLFSSLVNNNNPKFKRIYYGASTLFGVYGLAVFVLLVYNTVLIFLDLEKQNFNEEFIVNINILRFMILFVILGHALPVIWTCSFRKYVEMLTSMFSYLFFTPTYINILSIFAFCRIDDLSWGTKGLDSDDSGLHRDWEKKKYVFVLQFISINVAVSYALVRITQFDYGRNILILASTILVSFLIFFRLIFAFIYLVKYYLKKPFSKFTNSYRQQNIIKGQKILNALRMIETKMKEIEKTRTKRKKEEEYRRLANATSFIVSKTLLNFGSKLHSKVTQHLLNNNLLPRKELLKPQRKKKMKKRLTFKKLAISDEDKNDSQQVELHQNGKRLKQKYKKKVKVQQDSSDEQKLLQQIPQSKRRSQIKARIQKIKGKSKSKKQLQSGKKLLNQGQQNEISPIKQQIEISIDNM